MKLLSKNFGLIQKYIIDNEEFTESLEKLLINMEDNFFKNKYSEVARESGIFTESILQYIANVEQGSLQFLINKLQKDLQLPTEIIDAIYLIKRYRNFGSHSNLRRDKTFLLEMDEIDAIQILKASFKILKYCFLVSYQNKKESEILEDIKNWTYSKEIYLPKRMSEEDSSFSSIDDSTSVELRSLTDLVYSTKQFVIPTYQRKYTWSKESIEVLIADIHSRINDKKQHYMGALAIAQSKGDPNLPKRIIDGQQRITTTLLLLKAISDTFDKNDWVKPKELELMIIEIEKKYANKATINKDQKHINKILSSSSGWNFKTLGSSLNDFFEKSISFINYTTFLNHLNQLDKEGLLEFYTTFAMNFVVAELLFDRKIDDEIDIFENLNSKGTDLSSWDLIKNYFFTRFDSNMLIEKEEEIEQIIRDEIVVPTSGLFLETWEDKINSFFNFYNRIQYVVKKGIISENKNIAHKAFKEVWPSTKVKFTNVLNFEEELEEVVKYLEIFNILASQKYAQDATSPLAFAALHLKNLSLKDVHFPLIMEAIYKNTIWDGTKIKKIQNQQEVLQLTKILDVYITRLLVFKGTGQSLGGLFDKILLNFVSSKKIENRKIWKYLNSLEGGNSIPSLKQFISALDQPISSKEMSMSILRSIEHLTFEHSQISGKYILLSNPTLEHIFPQKPNETWDREGMDERRFRNELKNNYLNKIGNHLILGHKLNIKASNNGFSIKVDLYKNESTKLIKGFSHPKPLVNLLLKSSFRFEDIDNRTKQIKEICKLIYKDF